GRDSLPGDAPHTYRVASIRAPRFGLPSALEAPAPWDTASGRAGTVTATRPDPVARARNLAEGRVRVAGQAIESTLRGVVKGSPSLGRLPPFYRELVDLLVDEGRLKKHLGAADWAADRSAAIARDYRRRIGRAEGKTIGELRQQAYGRLSSVVKQVAPDLDALIEARRALRRIPQIDPDVPTI